MRNLIAIPIILLALILQSAVISRVFLLSGIADLPMLMLAAWALQENVESAWHWAAALGIMVGFVSAIPWYVPVISYIIVVAMAQLLQRRVIDEVLGLVILPGVLLNMLLAIPVYAIMRDLSRWVYPAPEVE
jgi:hypothetical protein